MAGEIKQQKGASSSEPVRLPPVESAPVISPYPVTPYPAFPFLQAATAGVPAQAPAVNPPAASQGAGSGKLAQTFSLGLEGSHSEITGDDFLRIHGGYQGPIAHAELEVDTNRRMRASGGVAVKRESFEVEGTITHSHDQAESGDGASTTGSINFTFRR